MRMRRTMEQAGCPARGFTLTELTVVLTIIGILAAILFPVFAQARSKARQVRCQNHLYQIGLALQLYARDHDGRLPPTHHELRPAVAVRTGGLALLFCPDDWLHVATGPASSPDPARDAEARELADPAAGALYSSYQYRGGLTLEDRPDIPVAGDWEFSHTGGANVLYLDGSVKWQRVQTWAPVAPGPRPLPSGIALPTTIGETPFLNGKQAGIPEPGGIPTAGGIP